MGVRKMQDEELTAQVLAEEKQAEIHDLERIFSEIDEDGSGTLSEEEFVEAVTNNEAIKVKLQLLELLPQESLELWTLLDEGNGQIEAQKFCDVLRSLGGSAKAKDSFSIVQRMRRMNKRIASLRDKVKSDSARALQLKVAEAKLEADMVALLTEVRSFIDSISYCVPQKPHAFADSRG